MLRLWTIKVGIRKFFDYLRIPYFTINPNKDNNEWHEHICLPLRLGKEVYDCFCPHKSDKTLEPEWSDCCDGCDYFAIIDAPYGKLRIIQPKQTKN